MANTSEYQKQFNKLLYYKFLQAYIDELYKYLKTSSK